MPNALNLLVPKYAAPADWSKASVRLSDVDLPLILRTGTYIGDQTTLDAVVDDAIFEGVALVYLDIPPMGYTADPRLSNPEAFYPTPALLAEMITATGNLPAVGPRLESWPIYIYGNSYSILTASFFTAGQHYTQLLSSRMGGGAVTSYGVGGKRIIDVLSTLIRGSAFPGCNGTIAGGLWTTTTARNGLLVLETAINDFAHYPDMDEPVAIPAALPSANTKYRDTVKGMWRAALAYMSSESRVEGNGHSATSGTWTDSGSTYASGGGSSFTSAAGAYREYTLTPPQSGPLAGKVFLLGFTLDAAVGTMAQQQISVDGTLQTTRTPPVWEQYVGNTGANVNVAVDCVAVTLPVDGASHVVRVTHNGAGGQLMYVDNFVIPSIDPNPIAVPGAEHPLTGTPTWTSTQTAVYTQNEKTMTPDLKSVVAEFPNAFYVVSTMTPNGLYATDGLHPNNLGMIQRSNDLYNAIALSTVKSRLDNRAADLNYP